MSAMTVTPALSADRRAARTLAQGTHPAGAGRTRRSRATPRRTAPAPLPVEDGLALARRPWHLQPTGPGLSPAALGEDTPLDVLAGLSARRGAETAPARLVVRGAVAADLPALAALHGRCTGTTLLQRYRSGGRAPSLTALTEMLREPLVLVVMSAPRHVVAVATAHVGERPSADFTTEMGVLVEDAWQARGIGRALAGHVGASLRHLGYGQVVTRSATSSLPLSRVMEGLGTTRHVLAVDGGAQLLTRLDVDALDGLAGGAAPAGSGVAAR
ncbi:hypothetical protein [uncultured Pseudokineococcus sp.]|uniref:hypothetical protein n=1 Tax=uncultured Pseudokineococcus sp. TaxID=1642928 RepID=UPI00260B4B84|nr:hypothetical protein [uncultured Pseudokineococcus sp.]